MFLRRFFSSYFDVQNVSPDLIGFLQQNLPVISNGFGNTPAELDSLSWLYNVAPCFPVKGEQIQVLYEPKHFYDTMVQRTAMARKRIVLASLYLGTGPLENSFVEALRETLLRQSSLRLNVLLDFTRGTRGETNSKTMLLPLIQEFGEQVQLSLYHTPNLRGFTKRFAPPRWNELLGLQHMKVYLFDDAVLISGANLSNDYFTNRQDRYILIEDKNLADFYSELLARVQEFSLLVYKNSIGLHKNWKLLPYEGTKEEFVNRANSSIIEFMRDVCQRQRNKISTDADTWVFPLIEMGQIGIHHDSIVTKRLLSNCISGSTLKLATGYFNLTEEYMNTITHKCLAQCQILMAHPNANGFQGAKGPAGSIPAAYSLIAKSFYENLMNHKQNHRVNFFEFEKPGWTYHAKGLWYYLSSSNLPNLTLIGSSNFGERSVNRDVESQVCLITINEQLSEHLQIENEILFKHSTTAEQQITTRPVPHWVRAVVKIFRNFF